MGISREQALDCLRSDDLVGIGMEADAVRRRLHPEGVVSYAVGVSLDASAEFERLAAVIAPAVDAGATGVRLTGLDAETTVATLRAVRQRFPGLWIEAATAGQVREFAARGGTGLRETLTRLRDAGLDSIAGQSGALDAASVEKWLEVHRVAHELGMRTTARMVFGAGETLEQRVDLLEAVRGLQQQTGGFAAFAPVAAEPANGRELDGVTAVERLKMLAVARISLDCVENFEAGATGEGLKVLQTELRFGANDAGWVAPVGSREEDVRRVIRDAGFQPAQRDVAFRAMMLG